MSAHTDVPHLHVGDALDGLLTQEGTREEDHTGWLERQEDLRQRACRFVAAEGVKHLEAQHGCTGRGCTHRNHRRDVDWVKREMRLPELLDAMGLLESHPLLQDEGNIPLGDPELEEGW